LLCRESLLIFFLQKENEYMRTANPALNEKTFRGVYAESGKAVMTLQGTVNKTFIMLLILLVSATYTWHLAMMNAEHPQVVTPWLLGGLLGGLVMALVTMFVPRFAMVTAPVYAGLEGLFLGAVSAFFEYRYPGIVVQAVTLTFGTLFCLLAAYTSGYIRATENFKLGVVSATGAIFLIYLVSWILSFFGIHIGMIHDSGLLGIGFSLFVVVIAALNLVLDFDFIESATESGNAPKYMEWVGAFGLMVTLVWLYIEILRLLAKLRNSE
jgi:uncharacterized YccA/Bax inhibitor family protein